MASKWLPPVPRNPDLLSGGLGHHELCQNGTLKVTDWVWRVYGGSMEGPMEGEGRGKGGGREGEGRGKGEGKVELRYRRGAPPVCHFGTQPPPCFHCQSVIATPITPLLGASWQCASDFLP